MVFKTDTCVPKLGMMLVGLNGNNGSTVTAGILANKFNLCWNTKDGEKKPNYFGSITQAGTVGLGVNAIGEEVHVPFNDLVPMVHPNDIEVDGKFLYFNRLYHLKYYIRIDLHFPVNCEKQF